MRDDVCYHPFEGSAKRWTWHASSMLFVILHFLFNIPLMGLGIKQSLAYG